MHLSIEVGIRDCIAGGPVDPHQTRRVDGVAVTDGHAGDRAEEPWAARVVRLLPGHGLLLVRPPCTGSREDPTAARPALHQRCWRPATERIAVSVRVFGRGPRYVG